jgi:hypothetical protein
MSDEARYLDAMEDMGEKMVEMQARIQELTEALEGTLQVYVAMAASGDCGNWDPEIEEHVIKSRRALHKDSK